MRHRIMDFVQDSTKMYRIYKDFLSKEVTKQKARHVIRLFIVTGGQCVPLPVVARAVMVLYDCIKNSINERGVKLSKRITKIADKMDETTVNLTDALSVALQDADQILSRLDESEMVDIPFGYQHEDDDTASQGAVGGPPEPDQNDDMRLLQSLLGSVNLNAQITDKSTRSSKSGKGKKRKGQRFTSSTDLVHYTTADADEPALDLPNVSQMSPSDDDDQNDGSGGQVDHSESINVTLAASSG